MNLEKLIEILVELRTASLALGEHPTEQDLRDLIEKYNLLFLGGNFNSIYSIELRHSLKEYFNLEIENTELNHLIPNACKTLNMNYEPMAKVEDFSNPTPYCYQITLW